VIWRVLLDGEVRSTPVIVPAVRRENTPKAVLADAGVENVNAQVDELIHTGVLRRVLAFTELKFSNSLIEAWWRSLALPPLAGQRHNRPSTGRVLRPRTQPGASPFGVSRTDA
jgi:hypothetical protein